MTLSTHMNKPALGRRAVLAGLGSIALVGPAQAAMTLDQARSLIDRAIGDVNAIIASGKSESAMFPDFERVFRTYADVPAIARSSLGAAARGASGGQMQAYTKAFSGYLARKYGRRFREFIGGQIEVTGAQPLKSYFEVISTAKLRGKSPFDLRWHVSDKGGKPLFFNLIIEGVNMLAAERTEVGAMLDRRKGDLNALIDDLNKT